MRWLILGYGQTRLDGQTMVVVKSILGLKTVTFDPFEPHFNLLMFRLPHILR